MHHLRSVSVLMVVGGLALLAAAAALDLSPAWGLTGLLLAWAGAVKVLVVYLWRGLAGADRPAPIVDDD